MGLSWFAVEPRLFLFDSLVKLVPKFTPGRFSLHLFQSFYPELISWFNLLVDIKGRKVVQAQCPESVVLYTSPTPQPASYLSAPPQIQRLLSEFPDMLSSDSFTALRPCHGVRHHILTSPGPPVYSKPR